MTLAFRRIRLAVLGRDALATDRSGCRMAKLGRLGGAAGEECPNFRSDSDGNDREVISKDI